MVLIFKKGRHKGIVLKGKRAFIFQRGYKVFFCIGRFYKGGRVWHFTSWEGWGKLIFFVPNGLFSFVCPFNPGIMGG